MISYVFIISIKQHPYPSDFPITSFVIGGGSIQQLINDTDRITGNKLCIVGDRPDIQIESLKLGMHLLITGDSRPSLKLIHEATKHQLLLSLHHSCHNYTPSDLTMNCAGDWMHDPEYLYYNDILSDWYRTYFPIFSLNNKFAIVNDDLDICGSLNTAEMDKPRYCVSLSIVKINELPFVCSAIRTVPARGRV